MLSDKTKHQVIRVLQQAINRNEVAGANILVYKDGEEVFYHEAGMRQVQKKLPIQRDTIFRLYSMTKPITAVAVMLLFERGLIDLFDPVCQFIPGFIGQHVEDDIGKSPVSREVTIKDLLSMTSGLVYPKTESPACQATQEVFEAIDEKLLSKEALSTYAIANLLGQCPLAFEPGSSWQYGTSADVLGAIVEVVSGVRFGEFLEQELFKPLGMDDTGFWVPATKRHRLASAYATTKAQELKVYEGNHLGIINGMDRLPAFESGGAGLVSTIDDYAKFTQMLMHQGRHQNLQILQPRTVKYLTSSTLHPSQQQSFDLWYTLSGHSYGNLMRVMTECSQAGILGSQGEYGWDGWLGAYFCNCPKDELNILIMMQKKDAGTISLTRKLRNIIYASI